MQQQPAQQKEINPSVQSTDYTSSTVKEKTKFKRSQIVIFLLTALLYALNHSLRTVWGYAKPYFSKSNSYYTSGRLGVIDFSFAVSYAVGQFFNGPLADRMNVKIILFVGSTVAIIGLCLLASVEAFLTLDNLVLDAFAFILNGLGQSTGYSTCVKIVSNWFGPANKGLVFGLWGTNLNIGNIIGQQIGRIAINVEGLRWEYPIYITCGVFGFVLIVNMLFVKIRPQKAGRTQVREVSRDTEANLQPLLESGQSGTEPLRPIPFLDAWKIMNVPFFAVSVFCVKGVYSGLMSWLPFYLTNTVKLPGDISALLAAVEIGMLIGSGISGLATDKVKSRSMIISGGFFFSVVFLVSIDLIQASQSKVLYFFLLLAAGMGMGGANTLIGGTVSSELGANMKNNKGLNATSTIVGIMEGSGGVGSAVTQLFVANFTQLTFEYFATLCFLGGTFLIPVAIRDYKKKREENSQLYNSDVRS